MDSAPPLAVVLVRPTESGNIGSVARAMANTGLSELIIVEPAAPIDATARAFAVGAGPVLDGARHVPTFDQAIAPFRQIVGTSSQRSRAPKVPLATARDFARAFGTATQPATALVFGPERSGLTTDELARCTQLVTIPASRVQPTLNLAQAVLIVAHEIFVARPDAEDDEPPPDRASAAEIEGLLAHLRAILEIVGFARDDTFEAVFRDLRRLVSRASLTPREVGILRGMLRRTEYRLFSQSRGVPVEATGSDNEE